MGSGFRLLVSTLRSGQIDHRLGPEHVILGLRSARVSGSLVLGEERSPRAVLVLENGMVRKARSTLAAYLGGVLYELGRIDQETLNSSLGHVAEQRQLHGAVLRARRAIDDAGVQAGLREQVERRLADIVGLPESVPWKLHENEDWLAGYGGPDWPLVDPLAGVWRGLRSGARAALVHATLARSGEHRFMLAPSFDPAVLGLDSMSLALLRSFRTPRPLVECGELDTSTTSANLRHLLVLAGVLRVVEEPGFQVPQQGRPAAPARPPSGTMPAAASASGVGPIASRPTQGNMPAAGSGGLSTPERALESVRALLAAGKQSQAHVAALLAVSRFDGFAPLRVELAWVEANAEGSEKADKLAAHLGIFNELLKEHPESADAFYYRGLLFRRQGDAGPALRDLRKTLECDSTHLEALRDLRLFNARRENGASALEAMGMAKPLATGKRAG